MDIESKKSQCSQSPRKTWGIFPIIDFYVFREYLIPLTVLILGFIILFLIGDIFDDLRDFLENNAPLDLMISYFLFKLPGNIRFILPISVLLACMYTMAKFGKNLEITAMRASGISLQRCCCSIYALALIITLINFWFNESAVPLSEEIAANIMDSVTHPDYNQNLRKMLTYRSPDGMKTWFFKFFDVNGLQKSVILKKYRSNASLDWDIKAEEAEFKPGIGWEFHKATFTPYSEDGHLPGSPMEIEIIKKDIKEFPETPEDIINAVRPAEELNSLVILDILRKTKNMGENCKNLYETTLYYRVAFPWACIIAVFLGIPLAGRNERGGIFTAIVIAVAIIVVYQISSHIFLILGKRGIIPPIVAGIGPTLAFIIYGWYNMYRHR